MRLFAVLAALCALCQTATAQTPDCKLISGAGARLACYDKTVAPVAASTTAKPVPAAKADAGKYVDTIGAEDALMNARLKNICRGC
jgi:sugar/nucleoside kinase (ribokinase family)